MPSQTVKLHGNWLYDEFRTASIAGDRHAGSAILYTCQVCPDVEPFQTKTAARKHAGREFHRRRIAQTAAERESSQGASGAVAAERSEEDFEDCHGRHSSSTLILQAGLDDSSREVALDTNHTEDLAIPEAPDSAQAPPQGSWWGVHDFEDVNSAENTSDTEEYEIPAGLPHSEDELDGDDGYSESEREHDTTEDGSDSGSEADGSDSASSAASDTWEGGHSDKAGGSESRKGKRQKRACWPYPNLTWCILDIMLNLPRHPISDELLKIFLWALKMLGVKNVPSIKSFRKFQARLRQVSQFRKERANVSVLGNHFTTNSILKSVALDMANPYVRRRLVFYPEEPVEGVSELRHSWKWFAGLPDKKLTPMWAARGVHYYVGEAAELINREIVVPLRWYTRCGQMYMFYYSTRVISEGILELDISERHQGPAANLAKNLPQLLCIWPTLRFSETLESGCTGCFVRPLEVNKWRIRANGRPCYVYFILLGGDDVSGNRSKAWNKHWCFYFCAAGLPLECLNQEYFMHYISTSQYAGPVEQAAAITAELSSVADTGFACLDAGSEDGEVGESLVIPDIFVGTGDGPWQSELSSHSGDCKPCRFCEVGGTVKERSSDAGFLAIMEVGKQRTPAETVERIQADLALATKPRKGAKIERNQQKSGVVDSLAQRVINDLVERGKALYEEKDEDGKRIHSPADIERTLQGLKADQLATGSFINSLLSDDLSFNPHQDTAVGRLHLVLLGFTKYFWSASLPVGGGKKLSAKERETLETAEATLYSLSQSGLGDRSLRPDYVMHFRGSLVGRHLHSIAQLAVFIFARIVEPVLHTIWVTLSKLCAMLFVNVIKDMAHYKLNLKDAIDNFYDAVCAYNPTWVMYKNKFHYLAHIPEMIERFGVLGLVAEDRFEKFHGLWRHSSIYSNHHAASRDSAQHFNSLDATKHVLSGGLFHWEGHATRAGSKVLEILNNNRHIRQRLGLRTDNPRRAGYVRRTAKVRQDTWGSLPASTYAGLDDVWPAGARRPMHDFYEVAQWLVTRRGDTCRPGSFVWCTGAAHEGVARVRAIYARGSLSTSTSQAPEAIVELDTFILGDRHPTYDCPQLTQATRCLASPHELLFLVNVQHNCIKSECPTMVAAAVEEQERMATSRRRTVVQHANDEHFVLNLFVLHHYDELVTLVPASLTKASTVRTPEDRKQIRLAAAEVLRKQNQARETTKGAVRAARSAATARAKGASGDVDAFPPTQGSVPRVDGDEVLRRKRTLGSSCTDQPGDGSNVESGNPGKRIRRAGDKGQDNSHSSA